MRKLDDNAAGSEPTPGGAWDWGGKGRGSHVGSISAFLALSAAPVAPLPPRPSRILCSQAASIRGSASALCAIQRSSFSRSQVGPVVWRYLPASLDLAMSRMMPSASPAITSVQFLVLRQARLSSVSSCNNIRSQQEPHAAKKRLNGKAGQTAHSYPPPSQARAVQA